jgi:hypothetical protein
MYFKKEDMAGTHYTWSASDKKQVFAGQPSRKPFDRFNGDQVLFLINFYGSILKEFTLQDGRVLEQDILKQLPINAMSEISAINWIRRFCFTAMVSKSDRYMHIGTPTN